MNVYLHNVFKKKKKISIPDWFYLFRKIVKIKKEKKKGGVMNFVNNPKRVLRFVVNSLYARDHCSLSSGIGEALKMDCWWEEH